MTVLELVVGASLMVRAWFFQHLVENASIWRASGPLRLHGGDEIVVEVFLLELPRFLLLLVFLGTSAGGPSSSAGCLPFLPSQLKKAPTASSPAA